MLRIDPWIYWFAALLMLILPLEWVISVTCAAIFHELCHIWAIKRLGGSILSIQIRIGGAVIDADIPGKREELLSAIAGPVGSFLLLFLCHIFPMLSIAACIQGLFNLIPIYPLDGGRIWKCILDLICPSKAETILQWTEILTYLVTAILAATLALSMGFLPLIMAGILIIKAILRKRPCKRSQIRVQ